MSQIELSSECGCKLGISEVGASARAARIKAWGGTSPLGAMQVHEAHPPMYQLQPPKSPKSLSPTSLKILCHFNAYGFSHSMSLGSLISIDTVTKRLPDLPAHDEFLVYIRQLLNCYVMLF